MNRANLFALAGVLLMSSPGVRAAQIDVQLPPGFQIEKIAGNDLATDIYCLAVNSRGDVLVSGPGYIRKLIDADADGIFDSAGLFADRPQSGAQGLLCIDEFVFAVGDDGVWRFEDRDRNGLADGPPEKMLAIGTGGEHLAHAIRRGPDGWFYLLAGNATPIKPEYSSGPFSPVKQPRAGFLMRMSPDFRIQEVVAHGFRNAYDFAFNDREQIFVYDSDGERDVSLPWYRPTRVFQIQPGDDAGWIDEGWRRPSSFFDMPIEVGALGRGSPTGVECYRGSAFPPEFADAIFVADWTFGKITVFKVDPAGNRYDRGSDFAVAEGQFGFAVTDLVVDRDGSLLVSVGGRGTAGAVYRISPATPAEAIAAPEATNFQTDLDDSMALLQQRSAWNREETISVLQALSGDDGPASLRALQSLVGRVDSVCVDNQLQNLLISGVLNNLKPFDLVRAKLVCRIVSCLSESAMDGLDRTELPIPSQLLLQLVEARGESAKIKLLTDVVANLKSSPGDLLAICRVGQLALGDCGNSSVPEMFRGYVSNESWLENKDARNHLSAGFVDSIKHALALGETETAEEIGRLAAMSRSGDSELQQLMLAQITPDGSPVADIHWMNCLAQTGSIDAELMRSRLAEALANLDRKIQAGKFPTDQNWVPRMGQLATQLIANTPKLASDLLIPIDGRDGQSFLVGTLPESMRESAIVKFAGAIENNLDQATQNQLRVVIGSRLPSYQPLLRRAAQVSQLRELAVLELTKFRAVEDRELFVEGLNSWNNSLVKNCAIALRRMGRQPQAELLLSAFQAAGRLGWDAADVATRDQLMLLLQLQTGQTLGYQFKQPDRIQAESLQRWGVFLKSKHPIEFEKLFQTAANANWVETLTQIDWSAGDLARGKLLYQQLKCAQCHDGNMALGPRLEGITKRFGREDLFRSILEPSAQISDRYRAVVFQNVDGLIFKGTIVYESVDGVTLQDANGETIRINQLDIESRKISQQSVMPDRLLDGIRPEQWADLEAYLKSL